MRSKELSEYLLEVWGIQLTPSTLAKLRCTGGAVPYQLDGRFPVTTPAQADAWASKRLGPERRSTSDIGDHWPPDMQSAWNPTDLRAQFSERAGDEVARQGERMSGSRTDLAPELAQGPDRGLLGDGQTDGAGVGASSDAKCRALGAEGGKTNNGYLLVQAYRRRRAPVIKEAKQAGLDPNALRRRASQMRVDPAKMAEREALDHQHRFPAGELPGPAPLPRGTRLGRVVEMLRDNEKITVRQIAKAVGVSVGTAQTLRRQATAFNVQSDLNMNKCDKQRAAGRSRTADVANEHQTAATSDPGPIPSFLVRGTSATPKRSIDEHRSDICEDSDIAAI
jgi:hypothetical protein